MKSSPILRVGLPAERVVRVILLGIVAVGIGLRARGYLFSTEALWGDEAGWAVKLQKDPLVELLIRPIGFMAVTKALTSLLSPTETVLRALPWAAGIGVVALSPLLARQLFQSAAARLLFVAILALDPAAIDLAKEFKPYSVSLGLHAALLFTVLRYRDTRRARDLAWVLVLAVPGVLFAQDAVFAYPSIFLVIAVDAVMAGKSRHLLAIIGAAMVTLGIVGSLYVFVWSKLDQSKEERYWGKKYDVFYVPPKHAEGDQVGWLSTHYTEVIEMPGERSARWDSPRFAAENIHRLKGVDDLMWLVLHVAGLTVLVRSRRFREGLLLFGPLVVMLTFNVLGRWPMGAFRTNLFTLVYASGIAAFALDRTTPRTRWADLLPALVLVLAPLLVFERFWHARKGTSHMATTSYMPEALRTAIVLRGPPFAGQKESLLVDTPTCPQWDYYTKYHPTVSRQLAPELRRRFNYHCVWSADLLRETRRRLRTESRVWVIASNPRVVRDIDGKWPDDLRKIAFARMGSDTQLVLGVTMAPPVTQEEQAPTPRAE